MQIKSAANLLQKFGIHKDLTVKIKFIWIFSGKSLICALTSERKFLFTFFADMQIILIISDNF